MSLGEFGNWVLCIIVGVHSVFACSLAFLRTLNLSTDRLLDCELDRTLGDKAKISTGESVSLAGDEVDIDNREPRGSCGAGPSGYRHGTPRPEEGRRQGYPDGLDGRERCQAAQVG